MQGIKKLLHRRKRALMKRCDDPAEQLKFITYVSCHHPDVNYITDRKENVIWRRPRRADEAETSSRS
jgi:hypothetical protein